jgi:hypothetical protein
MSTSKGTVRLRVWVGPGKGPGCLFGTCAKPVYLGTLLVNVFIYFYHIYGAGHLVTATSVQWQNQVADATRHYHT